MLTDIKIPDSRIAREAEELARSVSTDTLFNHVMRCYLFAELFAQQESKKVDSELLFLSAVLHDLGLTDYADGPHRFEIEGGARPGRSSSTAACAASELKVSGTISHCTRGT